MEQRVNRGGRRRDQRKSISPARTGAPQPTGCGGAGRKNPHPPEGVVRRHPEELKTPSGAPSTQTDRPDGLKTGDS